MSTNFDKNFMTGSTVEASHIQQLFKPVEDLESGAALFSSDTGSANAYKVDFASGNEILGPTPVEGQVVNFRATNANTGSSTITITSPGGDLTPIALVKKGNSALVSGDIVAGQVVSALYVEDSGGGNGRFEVIGGVDGSGPITANSSSEPQLRLEYDASNYTTVEAQSDGDLDLVTTGNTFRLEGAEQTGPFAYFTGTSASTAGVLRDGRGQANPYTYLAFNKDSSNVGFIGFANSSLMYLSQGHATGDLLVRTTGTGGLQFRPEDSSGGRWTSAGLFIGKNNTPLNLLHVEGSTNASYQARFGYDSANYLELGANANGIGTLSTTGYGLHIKCKDFYTAFARFEATESYGTQLLLTDPRTGSGSTYSLLQFLGRGASAYVGCVNSNQHLYLSQNHATDNLYMRTTGSGSVLIYPSGTGHLYMYTNGLTNKMIELTDDSKIGFFGATPAVRQVVTTAATNADIVTALQNLGLFSAS